MLPGNVHIIFSSCYVELHVACGAASPHFSKIILCNQDAHPQLGRIIINWFYRKLFHTCYALWIVWKEPHFIVVVCFYSDSGCKTFLISVQTFITFCFFPQVSISLTLMWKYCWERNYPIFSNVKLICLVMEMGVKC